MLNLKTSTIIHAPANCLFDIYINYKEWNKLFSLTIEGTELVKNDNGKLTVLVHHKTAGRVINILDKHSKQTIRLEEFKPLYKAVFWNNFKTISGGTRYTVTAEISLKGFAILLQPFVKRIVLGKIRRFVLQPMKKYAELHCKASL